MSPVHRLLATLTLCGAALVGPSAAFAQKPDETVVPAADARIGRQLKALGYEYDVDQDGDYKMTFSLDNERSQLVYVISRIETFGKHRVREIWSPAYRAKGDTFPAIVANRLLEDSQASKMGGWVKQDDMALFVVKIAANASDAQLDDAVDYAMRVADEMEAELTTQDEF